MSSVIVGDYKGWKNSLFLRNGEVELVILTDVGPRIIHCAISGKPNLFKEFDGESGLMQGDAYALFGGHRLWHAPEAYPRSYSPDFDAVDYRLEDGGIHLIQREEPANRITKSMRIECLEDGRFRLTHGLTNTGPWPVELAPWCLTLMCQGSRALVPQEDFRSHPECLDAARTLTLWHYSRMDDPRVRWGRHFIQLVEDSSVQQKMKFGVLNKQRWAGCWSHGCLFIKTFNFDAGRRYADMGCNCEVFTMPGFLELESLGPLSIVEPGQTVYHEEIWHVWALEKFPEHDEDLAVALDWYLQQLTFPSN